MSARTLTRGSAIAVGSFGIAQASISLSALLRIPLTVAALGASSYGVIVLTTAAVPLFIVPVAAVRSATRTLVAEYVGAELDPLQVIRIVRATATRLALATAGTGCLAALLLPLGSVVGTAPRVGELEVRLLLVLAVLSSASGVRGAVGWGELEARGNVSVFNLHLLLITVGGLALTLLAVAFSAPFLAFGAIAVLTSTLPYISVGIAADRRRLVQGWYGRVDRVADVSIPSRIAVRRVVRSAAARASNEALIRGLDPAVVALLVSASAAAGFSVAQRLGQATLIVPVALAPVIAGHAAGRRGAGRAVQGRPLVRSVGSYALLGGIACVALVAVGGRIGDALLGGEVSVDRRLLLLIGVLGIVWSTELAIGSQLTGPRAAHPLAVIAVVSGVVNIVGTLTLTTRYGIYGPILASLVATSIAVGSMVVLIVRHPMIVTSSSLDKSSAGTGTVREPPE